MTDLDPPVVEALASNLESFLLSFLLGSYSEDVAACG